MGGDGELRLMGSEFGFGKVRKFLQMDSGTVCVTVSMYLVTLNRTLKHD